METLFSNPVAGMRKIVRSDFYQFLRYFWPEYSQEEFIPNWHIRYICNELQTIAERVAEGKPKLYDVLINIPPGSTKTCTVAVMFPIWCWTRWSYFRFITASYTSDVALESAEYARDIVKSDRFRILFPELYIKPDKDTKHNYRIVERKKKSDGRMLSQTGGNRFSTSVTGTVTGFHGHILIVDDPLDPRRAGIESMVDEANRWVGQTLSTRKVDKNVTPIVMIQQRLHQNDPTGYMLEQRSGQIKHICLPGEIENYPDEVAPQELKENYTDGLLDSKRLNWDALNDLETQLGQYAYASQIGQKPVPPGGGMFKVDNFKLVDNLPEKEQIIRKVRYWDKAGTKGGGAYTAGVLMYQLRGKKWLIADVVRGQWESGTRERIIRDTAEQDGIDTEIFVEQEPGSSGKEAAEYTITNLSGFAAYADRPSGDKTYRADTYSVQVNIGNMLLVKADWNKDFIGEHRFFPKSKYKDQIDATGGAFRQLQQEKEVVVWD